MAIVAIYPGTFDPLTLAHVDIIERSAQLFSRIIVAVAASHGKKPLFDLDERIALASAALANIDGVSVLGFSGLLTEFAQQQNAHVVIRGLRTVGDFDYEFQLARMNRALAPSLETLFLTPNERYAFISASLVREIASLQGDVSQFVSPVVMQALQQKYAAT